LAQVAVSIVPFTGLPGEMPTRGGLRRIMIAGFCRVLDFGRLIEGPASRWRRVPCEIDGIFAAAISPSRCLTINKVWNFAQFRAFRTGERRFRRLAHYKSTDKVLVRWLCCRLKLAWRKPS